ncbi:MAG: hypothetical protein KKB38_20955 [Gammaproteobacteria bacterium]|nr:hypothetical protein [Gammaproteobacteria bacterium]
MTQYRQDVVGRQTPPAAALNRNKRARPLAFDSVAAMRADALIDSDGNAIADGEAIELMGYYARNDDGGGLFVVDRTDTISFDDSGLVIVTTAGVRLKRVRYDDYTKAEWWGARGDGVTDDTEALQHALDEGILLLDVKTYVFSDRLRPISGGIVGKGIGRSVLKLSDLAVYDNTQTKFRCIGSAGEESYTGILLEGFSLDCNFDNQGKKANGRVLNTIEGIAIYGGGITVRRVEVYHFGVGDRTATGHACFPLNVGSIDNDDLAPNSITECVVRNAGTPALMNTSNIECTCIACGDGDTYNWVAGTNNSGRRPGSIERCNVCDIDLSSAAVGVTISLFGYLGDIVRDNYLQNCFVRQSGESSLRAYYRDSWRSRVIRVSGNYFSGVNVGIMMAFLHDLTFIADDVFIENNVILLDTTDARPEFGIYFVQRSALDSTIQRAFIARNTIVSTGFHHWAIRIQYAFDTSKVGRITIQDNRLVTTEDERIVIEAQIGQAAALVRMLPGNVAPKIICHHNLDGQSRLVVPYLRENAVNIASANEDVQQTAIGFCRDQRWRTWAGATVSENPFGSIGTPLFVGEIVLNTTSDWWWQAIDITGATTDWHSLGTRRCTNGWVILEATDQIPSTEPMIMIEGSGGPITLTSDPCVQDGLYMGQELQIIGFGWVNKVTIPHQLDKVNLAGGISYQLDQKDTLRLTWTGPTGGGLNFGWVETARAP